MRRSLVTILALAGTVGLAVATATAAPHTNRLTAAANGCRSTSLTMGNGAAARVGTAHDQTERQTAAAVP